MTKQELINIINNFIEDNKNDLSDIQYEYLVSAKNNLID